MNEVRKILMNDLGITREYVRNIVDDIVKEIVSKRLDAVNIEAYLDKIIARELLTQTREGGRVSGSEIRGYVQCAAQEAAKVWVKEHLKIV